MTKLTEVSMFSNDCIDDTFFDTPSQISRMPSIVDEKCGFNESEANGNSNELQRKLLEETMTTRANDSKVNEIDCGSRRRSGENR